MIVGRAIDVVFRRSGDEAETAARRKHKSPTTHRELRPRQRLSPHRIVCSAAVGSSP